VTVQEEKAKTTNTLAN